MKTILIRIGIILGLIILFLAVNILNPTETLRCKEIKKDLEYHCPYHPVNKNDDILVSQFKALYSAKADGSRQKNFILKAPPKWVIMMNSISPNHERILLTMKKEGCNDDWRKSDGRLCAWGRFVLWVAYHEGKVWVLKNLAQIYGFNSELHGWTSWQNNKYAFFNGLSYPENKPLPLIAMTKEDDTQAYQIRFDSNEDINIEPWGAEKMYRKDCLTGRLYPSHIQNSDTCVDGAKVVFARRCLTEPDPDYWAWWNTKNMDGTGGKCNNLGKPEKIPVLRNFIVEVDSNCQPKTAFDINNPIRQPRQDPIYKHMGSVAEWGEMMPAISMDGKYVAFHTVRGYGGADPEDNCAGVENNSPGYSVVEYCELNESLKCKEVLQVPLYENIYGAGQPFFFVEENGETSLIRSTGPGAVKTKIESVPNKNILLIEGLGGYPLK